MGREKEATEEVDGEENKDDRGRDERAKGVGTGEEARAGVPSLIQPGRGQEERSVAHGKGNGARGDDVLGQKERPGQSVKENTQCAPDQIPLAVRLDRSEEVRVLVGEERDQAGDQPGDQHALSQQDADRRHRPHHDDARRRRPPSASPSSPPTCPDPCFKKDQGTDVSGHSDGAQEHPPGRSKDALVGVALGRPQRGQEGSACGQNMPHPDRDGGRRGGPCPGGVGGVRESAERAERRAGEDAAAKRASAEGVADTPARPVAAAPMA